jgi:Spy/CpxP family protein refolding chaperone
MSGNALLRVLGRALVGGALVASLAANARPPGPPGDLVARHAERLGLDAETQAAIQQIVAESEALEKALRARKEEAHQRMRELLSQPETDREAVMRQADVIEALRAEAHRSRLDTMLRIHEKLTPAQRAELVRLHGEDGPWRWHGPLGRCSRDLDDLCGGAADGPTALRCLADRFAEVSAPCRDAFGPPPEAPR